MPRASAIIHDARVRPLNDRPARSGRFVLYWMEQSQRARGNHALEYAIQRANALRLPVRVGFGLWADDPEATARHTRFMLEGLRETAAALADRGIPLVVRRGAPAEMAITLGRGAALVVCDRGYLRHQRAWRHQVALHVACPVIEVESDAVVPVAAASGKAEWGARTLRPRLHARLEELLVPLAPTRLAHPGADADARGIDLGDVTRAAAGLGQDGTVAPVSALFRGGATEARRRLRAFVEGTLARYADDRAHPEADAVSHLSMYLHFGQISPVDVAVAARELRARAAGPSVASFIEELVVRRELALNFVTYNERYDSYEAVPSWARATLRRHAADPRQPVYGRDQLERGETHDRVWNAAMQEMRHTGYLHNQMRMYWGKQILAWSRDPETAFATALALNNRYFLDGRDASSYANVAWLFGLHDRPWPERAVFGTVRTMTARGLERKGDVSAYVAAAQARVAAARRAGASDDGAV